MNENLCADAHPGWVALWEALESPKVLKGRQRGKAFKAKLREVARLVMNYHGIRAHAARRFRLVRERIAEIVGISSSATYRVLQILEDVGLIVRVGELQRRCQTGQPSPNPGITGACYMPIEYAIGPRFRAHFVETDGFKLANSPVENHSEQEKLTTVTESRTDSRLLDSEAVSSNSQKASLFLSALARSILSKGRTLPEVRPLQRLTAVEANDALDAQIAAKLALLRETQLKERAKQKARHERH